MKIEEKIETYLNEANKDNAFLFADKTEAENLIKYLKKNIKAPFVKGKMSRITEEVFITISLQKEKDWLNDILENSPYFTIKISPNIKGKNLDQIGRSNLIEKKFGRKKAKD
jgi:ankyrin repeat protein